MGTESAQASIARVQVDIDGEPHRHGMDRLARPDRAAGETQDEIGVAGIDFSPRTSRKPTRQGDMAASRGKATA